ncbi:hypothetical protein [Botrimarina mediterranea]|uniref:hypothetical protein n=1 Tax=Botrimarina mediterranea TaxID=2528022 RepID=UPI00118C793F|nr:hypothetical protein K2D_19530 [Planctomycetes bacterium K2D]
MHTLRSFITSSLPKVMLGLAMGLGSIASSVAIAQEPEQTFSDQLAELETKVDRLEAAVKEISSGTPAGMEAPSPAGGMDMKSEGGKGMEAGMGMKGQGIPATPSDKGMESKGMNTGSDGSMVEKKGMDAMGDMGGKDTMGRSESATGSSSLVPVDSQMIQMQVMKLKMMEMKVRMMEMQMKMQMMEVN